ncbi:MAG: hypothetical protein J5482_02655 [Oscillospiraceae bacterium]|nr:hypothetical protein [Oscillospiraceae bacterium]
MDTTYWAFSPDNPDWPTDTQGQKERAVLLRHTFDSPAEADMTVSLLSAYGIPSFPYYAGEGGAGKIISGFSGFGVSLYVPESMLQNAVALLAAQPVEEEIKEGEDA